LEADTDTWLLAADNTVPLDLGLLDFFDGSLEHQTVSVVGTMGTPNAAAGISKLIVEELASHELINRRAYQYYADGQAGGPEDHWLRAERELLNM